ncbi:uncharacterized protein LOC118754428 [Rhagoletis pomonella]|uniref:uncharacterized protein LOC118754428 n=1 Tax=Rhagoletis pomonella TaxID=28610 RepID=UPI001786E39F|nr:uncharacterized protein LOC118754428 [Rhagoletis pomonella]
MSSLAENKRKRANIKRNISRIKGVVEIPADGTGTRLPIAELQCRLGILEAYFKQALSVQSDIENEDPDDEGRANLEDSYVKIKLCTKNQLGEHFHNTVVDAQPSPTAFASSRLPRLSLSIFDGNRADYKNYITSFNQIIARQHNISNIEKFNHLLNCLKGPALETVQAFQVTSENYQKAIDRLNARFDNPTLTILETIAALFKLQPVNKPDGHQLRSLLDKATAMYSSLSSQGSGSTIAQAMLIYIVMEKCDQQTRNKWNEALNLNSLPTWEQCSQVLERHCQFLQSSVTTMHLKSEPARLLSNANQGQRLQSTFAISKAHCALCSNSEHKLAERSQFKGMSTNNRFDFIKKCGLCTNCLGTGHRMSQCPSKHRCRSCSRSHHTLLHNERPPPSQQPSISNSSTTSSSSQPVAAITHSHSNLSQTSNAILATAMILVKDSSGKYKVGRALLDSCSQVNFISEEFAQKLRLRRDKQHVEIRSIGNSRTNINFCATTAIKSRLTTFELSLQFCITPHIAYQPDCEIDTSQWNLPANTPLADESFNKSRGVDLLLGTETFFDLQSVGQIKLGANLPTLQKTLLG